MLGYAIRRVLWIIPVLLFVATVTFFLMHAVPGGPFDEETTRTASVQKNLENKYGLDEPLLNQYGLYLRHLVQFAQKAVRGQLGHVPAHDLGA